jgi:predicted PurR-regulated permease PerM
MSTRTHHHPLPFLTTLAASVGLVAVFYFGREVLIPLALSALVSFLLVPAVRRLEAWGLRRIPAVAIVSTAAMVPILVLGWVVVAQFLDFANALPQYQDRIEQKLESIKGPAAGPLSRISKTLRALGDEVAEVAESEGADAPTPVRVVEGPIAPMELMRSVVGPLIQPLLTLGIVIVFVIIILIHQEDLRDRLIRLIGHGQLTMTTRALDDLSGRLSRFLRMQFLVNFTYGVAIAAGLLVIGVPSAVFWGFMCMALRYVPYLGPIVAAAMPITLSLVTSDGWSVPLQTAALFLVVELVSNNIVEPWLYGRKTGVSVLAVLVAAVFWTWLWGIPGLFLSTPMTVCLVVAGRYVPQLAFLNILLGDQPVLPPHARVYQRLLAMDSDEALEVTDAYLTDHPLGELYDEVLIEALRLAGEDREVGTLDPVQEKFVMEAMGELVDESALRRAADGGPEPALSRPDLRTLCIPARDEADAAAARMLVRLLDGAGLTARALTLEDLGSDLGAVIDEFKPEILVISATQPHAAARARLRLRQVQRRAQAVRVVVGLWGAGPQDPAGPGYARLTAAGAEEVFGSLRMAAQRIAELATMPGSRAETGTPGAAQAAAKVMSPSRPDRGSGVQDRAHRSGSLRH